MINCIFTLDYEIYGNGEGSLRNLVYEPAKKLQEIFQRWDSKLVVFAEAAELEQIDKSGSDPSIGLVKQQLQDLYREGFEIGLHLHPQWCNARHLQGEWFLDFNEYNLCTLPKGRIAQIVRGAIAYLRHVLHDEDFTPLSFRAGNWLFQPTRDAASVLGEQGIRIDSSVFKGGLQRDKKLDYRSALKNGYYWPFDADVNGPDPNGRWIEIPIYTEMVPFWRMATAKRFGMKNGGRVAGKTIAETLDRIRDRVRFQYPLKFDFCRMTLSELTSMMKRVIRDDQSEPRLFRPVVAIGHTKDLTDFKTVNSFLAFLKESRIPITTFTDIHSKLTRIVFQGRDCAEFVGDARKQDTGLNPKGASA